MWYIWDERDGDITKCHHCNKAIKGSKYYMLSRTLGTSGEIFNIGSGCVKKYTGKTIKEIKVDTDQAIKN